MTQQINMDILKQADETTQQRIAEEFPINWEKEEIFEKAFRTYLERSHKTQPPAAPIRRYAMHIAGVAACCFLVLGAAYAVHTHPRQIPSIPNESTTAPLSAVLPTENTERTENTENTEKTEDTEHTVSETQRTSETSVPASVIMPPVTETGSILPETVPPPTTDPPEPPAITETVTTPSVPEITQPISTESQYEPTETSPETFVPEEPEHPTFPEVEAPDFPEEPDEPEESDEPDFPTGGILPGFDVSERDGRLEIVHRGQVSPSPTKTIYYEIESDVFLLEFWGTAESEKETTVYRLLHKETGEYFGVSQEKREQFRCFCESNAELTPYNVNGYPAFMAQYTDPYGRERCVLYWDDGYYTFRIISTPEHRELLPEIAEAFRMPDHETT